MRRNVMVIGTASALAVFLLLLTLISGHNTSRTASAPTTAPATLPPGFDPSRATPHINKGFNPVAEAREYRLEQINKRGQLTQIFGQSLTPKPQGVSEVEKPLARIHSSPSRVMEIKADKGSFVAPENQLRSGEFSDHVVLTIYECPKGRRVDIRDDSPDIKMRAYLDDARFDYELKTVESNGPVHLTTDRLDFLGRGLSLAYSDLTERLEHLEVRKGEQLRVKPGSSKKSSDASAITAPSATTATSQASSSTTLGLPLKAAATKALQNEPVQFYRAKLEQNVRVANPQIKAQGDTLELLFSFNSRSRKDFFLDAGLNDRAPAPGNAPGISAPGIGNPNSGGPAPTPSPTPQSKRNRRNNNSSSPANVSVAGLASTSRFAANRFSRDITPSHSRFGQLASSTMATEQSGAQEPKPYTAQSVISAMATSSTTQPTAALTTQSANDALSPFPANPGVSLAPLGPDDMIINWDGKLTIDPEDGQLSQDMVSPEDMCLILTGRPARVITARDEIISVAMMEYLSNGRRFRLMGTQQDPLNFDSLQLGGVLNAQQMVIFQAQGTGQILGPGSLTAHSPANLANRLSAKPSESDLTFNRHTGLAPGSIITWNDRLDMTFFLRDAQQLSRNDPVLVSALRSVSFQGGVVMHSPEFDLTADRLGVGLDTPEESHARSRDAKEATTSKPAQTTQASPGNAPSQTQPFATQLPRTKFASTNQRQNINSVKASGHVKIANRSPIVQRQLAIDADDLVVDMQKMPNGQVEPRRLVASGNVNAWQPGRWMQSGYLDVLLDPGASGSSTNHLLPAATHASLTTKPAVIGQPVHADDATSATSHLAIRYILARENVHAELANPLVTVDCDHLNGDVEADQLEVFGWPDKPAILTHTSGSLSGPQILMTQRDQTAHVLGPGTFTFIQDRGNARDPMKTNVTWTKTMQFDNRQGYAQFVGNVVADGHSARDEQTLTCQDLKLTFTPLPAAGTATHPAITATAPSLATRPSILSQHNRSLLTLTANENVVLIAQQKTEKGDEVATRLRIEGPSLVYDGSREEMQIVGKGKMLTEDYRKPMGLGDTGAVAFNSNGATLFTWNGLMSVDFLHNDLRMEDTVQMVHRSGMAGKPVQIDAKRLWADMESTNGVGGWMSHRSSKPKLMSVSAEGNVRFLTEDSTVYTDHLNYTGIDQMVKLYSDPPRVTRMQVEGQPGESRAQSFRAKFHDGRLTRVEIDHPEPGPLPVPPAKK